MNVLDWRLGGLFLIAAFGACLGALVGSLTRRRRMRRRDEAPIPAHRIEIVALDEGAGSAPNRTQDP